MNLTNIMPLVDAIR